MAVATWASSMTSRRLSPDSYLLTKDCGTPSCSASCTWVRPACSRVCLSSAHRRWYSADTMDLSTRSSALLHHLVSQFRILVMAAKAVRSSLRSNGSEMVRRQIWSPRHPVAGATLRQICQLCPQLRCLARRRPHCPLHSSSTSGELCHSVLVFLPARATGKEPGGEWSF